jgi:carboxylate-amine ligase
MADVCTDLDTAVTYAAVVRSLVRTLARRVEQGVPAPDIEPDLLAAARWRAARFGLSGDLVDPATGRLGAGRIVVRRFLAELEPDLRDAGEYDEIAARVATLTKAGTSATRQRAVLRRHHSMRSVVRAMVAETTEQLAAVTPSAPGPRTPADDTAN